MSRKYAICKLYFIMCYNQGTDFNVIKTPKYVNKYIIIFIKICIKKSKNVITLIVKKM